MVIMSTHFNDPLHFYSSESQSQGERMAAGTCVQFLFFPQNSHCDSEFWAKPLNKVLCRQAWRRVSPLFWQIDKKTSLFNQHVFGFADTWVITDVDLQFTTVSNLIYLKRVLKKTNQTLVTAWCKKQDRGFERLALIPLFALPLAVYSAQFYFTFGQLDGNSHLSKLCLRIQKRKKKKKKQYFKSEALFNYAALRAVLDCNQWRPPSETVQSCWFHYHSCNDEAPSIPRLCLMQIWREAPHDQSVPWIAATKTPNQ